MNKNEFKKELKEIEQEYNSENIEIDDGYDGHDKEQYKKFCSGIKSLEGLWKRISFLELDDTNMDSVWNNAINSRNISNLHLPENKFFALGAIIDDYKELVKD